MNNSLDTSPLKNYGSVFKVYVWLKRAVMIAVRAGFVAIVALTVVSITRGQGGSFSYSSEGGALGGIFWLVITYFFVRFMIIMFVMSGAMKKFAQINGFTQVQHVGNYKNPESPFAKMRVPSFKGKILAISLFPVIGTYSGWRFGFFSRQYKEGGIIRWRERKMDTVLWVELPKTVPHIIVDSRLNERARTSNLSRHYDKNQLLHFEGVTGDEYNVYAPGGNQIAALQLFTPDVLDVFYTKLPRVDIEIKDKTLWFVWRYGILDDKLAAALFTGMAAFMTEFSRQLETAQFSEQDINAELTDS